MPTTGFDIFEGFSGRAQEDRAQVRRQQELRDQQELEILKHLSTADNEDIRTQAYIGLLNFADPRKKRKGLAGYIGETEGHPALKGIAALLRPSTGDFSMNTQQGMPAQPTQAPGAGGEIRTPPGQAGAGAAAQSGTSPVQGGQMGTPTASVNPNVTVPTHALTPPPPAPTSTAQVQGPPVQAGGLAGPPPSQASTQRPAVNVRNRQPFMSPEERIRTNTMARESAEVEARIAGRIAAGFTPEEARELERATLRRASGAGGGPQRVAIELPDGTQHMAVFTGGRYLDPDTQMPFENARPLSRTGSSSLGANREAISRELFGKRASQLTPEEMATVNEAEVQRAGEVSYARGTGTGQAANLTKLNAPLTPEMAAQQGVPVGTTMAALEGIVTITVAQRGRLEAAKALAPQIDQMDALIQRVFPPASGLVGGITAAAVLTQKRLNRDPEIEQLDALVNLAVGNVARVIGAEDGRLTEQDAARARSALVDVKASLINGDTQETAIAKIRVAQDALRRIAQDIRSPGQILGTEKEIPSPGGGARTPPPTAPMLPPPTGAAGGAAGGVAAVAPNTAGIAAVDSIVYDKNGRPGIVKEVFPDGNMRVEWGVKK